MKKKYNVDLLGEAIDFMESIDDKTREKIYYNIRKSQVIYDPEFFKKLNELIWEFQNKIQLRIIIDFQHLEIEQVVKKLQFQQGFVKKTKRHLKMR